MLYYRVRMVDTFKGETFMFSMCYFVRGIFELSRLAHNEFPDAVVMEFQQITHDEYIDSYFNSKV